MCEKCNEAMLAAANTSLMLSQAAKNLYDMNAHTQADILAKAAAELFTEVKPEVVTPAPGKASPNASKEPSETSTITEEVTARAEADAAKSPLEMLFNQFINRSAPKNSAFHMDADGTLYLNGAAIARAVVVGGLKPTKH